MFISDYFSRERKVSKKSNLPCVRLWCHKVLDLIHLDQELKKAKNALFGTFTAVISLSQLRKLTKATSGFHYSFQGVKYAKNDQT